MAIGFFQKRIEDIINNVVSSDEAAALSAEQLAQLSSDLALYFSTVLLTLSGLLLVGLFVLWMVKRRANPASAGNKDLQRQQLLQELENQFQVIDTKPAVWVTNRSTYDAKVVYEFSLALTAEIRWYAPENIQTSWHMGDRMIVISDQDDLLTASVMEEILFWFRRLDRAVSSDLIKVEDLYSLWRQILPFAIDNRFSFMAAYFTEDDLEEIEAIRQVLIGVIRYCQQQKLTQPLSYINGRLDPLFFDELPKGMKTGLEAARQHKVNRKDPVVMDEAPIIVQETKTERKEPVVVTAEKPKTTARKEPTFSIDNVDIDEKKPD